MFLLEHQQQAHLDAALRRDAVETVLVEAEALACVQLIVLALVADDGLALKGGEDGVAGCAVRPSLPRTNVPLPSPPRYRVVQS